jgi:hypothetical protein
MRLKILALLVLFNCASAAVSEERRVYLEDAGGARLAIATLNFRPDGSYSARMNETVFADHFLSMHPFKCLEGPDKLWCHVPYPYAIDRNVSSDLTDIEYDFLFVWKGADAYGIDMWNGIYYRLSEQDGKLVGELHEMDMNVLAAPPAAGDMRPVDDAQIHPPDPDSHWLPRMVIE